MSGPVSTVMCDCLQASTSFRQVIELTKLNQLSTLHERAKWVSAFRLTNNKWQRWCSIDCLVPIGGLVAQAGWLRAKVRSATTLHSSVFITWTKWNLAIGMRCWWLNKHCPLYYCHCLLLLTQKPLFCDSKHCTNPTLMPSSMSVGATWSLRSTTNLANCLTLMMYLGSSVSALMIFVQRATCSGCSPAQQHNSLYRNITALLRCLNTTDGLQKK